MRGQKHKLPPKRLAVYDFIKAKTQSENEFPTSSDIAAHMGWKNITSANDCLNALVGRGLVRRQWTGRRYTYSLEAAE